MKWSQGLCASILMEEFFFSSSRAPKPQPDQDFPGVVVDPVFNSNVLAADWGLPAEVGRSVATSKRQLPTIRAES